jgi:hypothetical protein
MYDETTVIVPIPFTTEDYFLVMQLAKRKGLTRSQLIMDALKQYLLVEQERWKNQDQKSMTPRPQPEGEKAKALRDKKEGES